LILDSQTFIHFRGKERNQCMYKDTENSIIFVEQGNKRGN